MGKFWGRNAKYERKNGGERGIRTPERVNPLTVFENVLTEEEKLKNTHFLE